MTGMSVGQKKLATSDRFTVEAFAVMQEVIEATLLEACQVHLALIISLDYILVVSVFQSHCWISCHYTHAVFRRVGV